MRAGAGKIVSGRLLRGLTSGEEGGGEDAGDEIWTEMDADMAGGGVDAGCCWLERRYLDFGLRLDLRCALRYIDDNLYSSSESSGSAGSRGRATRRR